MNPHQVDLNDIVRHVEHFLCRVIGEDITLKSELHPEELHVLVDSSQIEQIMMNLATNARDAMPDGGLLTIQTGVVDLGLPTAGSGGCAPGRHALLTVSDTGTGMDEETRAKIFEPFFTTKEVGKGTGLGLAMAYGTVLQHNGQITVESEPGKGACFKVYLPLVPYQEPVPKQEPSPFEPHQGHELILVAEDEPAVRELVQGILTSFGYRVLLAIDGEDAVAKFEQHREEIGLVLLDMIMPKLSGKAAYDEISRLKPGIRAIFTSGYTADVIRSKGELGPEMELVMKPVHPLLLLRKVREQLDR
jgi:two-component system, cell cycle sensor histidine kinase and response regulator CckA